MVQGCPQNISYKREKYDDPNDEVNKYVGTKQLQTCDWITEIKKKIKLNLTLSNLVLSTFQFINRNNKNVFKIV